MAFGQSREIPGALPLDPKVFIEVNEYFSKVSG